MSHHIPDNLTTEGYTSTSSLSSGATLEETITKLNEVIEKLEELVALFIGEE